MKPTILTLLTRLAAPVAMLLCLLLPTSCGDKDYDDVVPADARLIVRAPAAQLASLLRATGLAHAGQEASLLPARGRGLDLASDLYAFQTADGLYGLALAMDDDDLWQQALGADRNVTAITTTASPARATWRGNWLLAWTGRALIILGPGMAGDANHLVRTAQQLFKIDGGMTGGPLYAHLSRLDGLASAARADCLPMPYGALTALALPPGFGADEVVVSGRWKIEQHPTRLSLESTFAPLATDEATATRFEEAAARARHLSTRMAAARCLATAEANVSGKDLLAYLKKDKTLGAALMSAGGDVDIEAMLASIDGDLHLSLPTLAADGSPVVRLEAQCQPKAWAARIPAWQQKLRGRKGRSLTLGSDGAYHYAAGSTHLYFRLSGDRLELQLGGTGMPPRPAATATPMAGIMHASMDLTALPATNGKGAAAVLQAVARYVHSLQFSAPDARHARLTVTLAGQ